MAILQTLEFAMDVVAAIGASWLAGDLISTWFANKWAPKCHEIILINEGKFEAEKGEEVEEQKQQKDKTQ